MHRCRRLPPKRFASVPNNGRRQSVLCLLLGASVATTIIAHSAATRAQTHTQVDSLLLEFYPDSPPACGNARRTLHMTVANGAVTVDRTHETGDGPVVYRRKDGAMTFMLGSTGCRIGATIGKGIQGAAPADNGASAATEWTPVPRSPDEPTLTQTHFDANNPACEPADVYLHLHHGVALLRLASRPAPDPQPDRADHGLQGPTGPLRGTIGRPGCEIGLLVFRAD